MVFEGGLGKSYSNEIEGEIYGWWKESGCFLPSSRKPPPSSSPSPGVEASSSSRYYMPMPPPNVTGRLHMGHAMFASLQDVMCRYNRMRGRETLWSPGTDHAGIATQMIVERIVREEGTTREEMGREEFIERCWRHKEECGGEIVNQLMRMGASADWTRERLVPFFFLSSSSSSLLFN